MWITEATPMDDYRVHLTFNDGTEKEIDLEPMLRGPIFQPLLVDKLLFRALKVDKTFGVLVWPNGADMDADVLYGTYHAQSRELASVDR